MKTKFFISVLVLGLFTVSTIQAQEIKQKDNKSEKTVMSTAKAMYTCSMHSDVKSDKPGECSKCGMELMRMDMKKDGMDMKKDGMHMKKEAMDMKKDGMDMKSGDMATAFICPMKCEDDKTYDKEGECPKCGMKLKDSKMQMRQKGMHK